MSTVFEPALLPSQEKERLCRDLLDEFGLVVKHAYKAELIIPCRVAAYHSDQERNPTGALNFEKLTYHCVGCHASGGLLWFIASHRGSSATEARQWLGQETGTDGHVLDLGRLLTLFDALYDQAEKKAPMPSYSEKALQAWDTIHPICTTGFPDLGVEGWGIPEQNLRRHRVGYAEDYPLDKHHTGERIVFPHFWQQRLVGWQSRRIGNDGTPKYLSSPDFPKDETIYNYDPDTEDWVYVVESMKSVIRHSHHTHFEATMGADITDTQIRLLGRHPRLCLWLDNDNAGWRALEGAYDDRGETLREGLLTTLSRTSELWVVNSPYAADPGDMSDRLVQRTKRTAVPWSLWARPDMLLCHRCDRRLHEGSCPRGGDQEWD